MGDPDNTEKAPQQKVDEIVYTFLNSAEWKIPKERWETLNQYRDTLETSKKNIANSNYVLPTGGEYDYDMTKISRTTGIRCLQLTTDQFSHKVPIDRILISLETARSNENDDSTVIFSYGFTENDQFNNGDIIMPIKTFERISQAISTSFDSNQVYNQVPTN